MMPTISHSSARIDTPDRALMPPKRMDTSRVSSTDIADHHLLLAPVVQIEPVPAEPPADRSQLLGDAARVEREGEEQEQRTDDERRGLLGERRTGQLRQPVLELEVPVDE